MFGSWERDENFGFILETWSPKYPLGKIITDTHEATMAIPAHCGCGRNAMAEGITGEKCQVYSDFCFET